MVLYNMVLHGQIENKMKFNIKDIKEGDCVEYEYSFNNMKFSVKQAKCIAKRKNSIVMVIFYNSAYKPINKISDQFMTQIWSINSQNIKINNITTETIKQTKKYYYTK